MRHPIVRLTIFDGVELPMIEIWTEQSECSDTFWRYVRYFPPVVSSDEEWLEMLKSGKTWSYEVCDYDKSENWGLEQ